MYLIQRILVATIIVSIAVLCFTSCSDSSNDSDNCNMAVDSVKIIDQKVVGDTTYYLVLRISGWHDKSEIIEIYNTRPTFDRCARSDVEQIDGDSLELDSTVAHLYFDVKANSLYIEYKEGKPDKDHNRNLKLEIK
jgi:hypothetical protein